MIIQNASHIRQVINQAVIDGQTCGEFQCGGNTYWQYMFCALEETQHTLFSERVPCTIWKYTKMYDFIKGEKNATTV